MNRERPVPALVMAILCVVFGMATTGIFGCTGAFLALVAAVQAHPRPQAPDAPPLGELPDEMGVGDPSVFWFVAANTALSIAEGMVLVALGVGLLAMSNRARVIAVVYAVAAAALETVLTLVKIVAFNPLMLEAQARYSARTGGAPPSAAVTLVTDLIYLLLFAGFHVALAVVLTRPDVVAAYRPPAAEAPHDAPT
jgi:hypothetical protein